MLEATLCSRCQKNPPEQNKKCCSKCLEYNKEYRKQRKRDRVLPSEVKVKRRRGITCGRRHCSDCGRWRPIVDFCVARWKDPIERTEPKYWRNICRTCERLRGRERNAKLNGRTEPYGPQKYVGQTPEERRQRRLKNRREWQRNKLENDPEWAERYREKQRFYAEKKRRERGAKPREVASSTYKKCKGEEMVAIKPFQDWIEEKIELYGSIEDFASLIETSPRTVHRWRTGREMDRGRERKFTEIPLNTVDVALTREGSNGLWELYPDLYK